MKRLGVLIFLLVLFAAPHANAAPKAKVTAEYCTNNTECENGCDSVPVGRACHCKCKEKQPLFSLFPTPFNLGSKTSSKLGDINFLEGIDWVEALTDAFSHVSLGELGPKNTIAQDMSGRTLGYWDNQGKFFNELPPMGVKMDIHIFNN